VSPTVTSNGLFTIGNASAPEGPLGGGNPMNFTVALSPTSTSTVTVNYTTVNGTALAGTAQASSAATAVAAETIC